MGLFGDRAIKRLRSELELGAMGVHVAHLLPVENFMVGLRDTERKLKPATDKLVQQGRSDEVLVEVNSARATGDEQSAQLWNEVLDRLVANLGRICPVIPPQPSRVISVDR